MNVIPAAMRMKVRRRLRLDGNPLYRRSDRVAAWLPLATIATFLVLSPLAVGVGGAWMRAENAAARDAAHPYTATAVVLQSAPGPEFPDHGANTWLDWVPARWTAGGQQHVGAIPVGAGTPAGTRVTVYLSGSGQVKTPPMTSGHAAARVLVAELIAVAVLAALMIMLALVARRMLERRRLASWQSEWLSVGPRWSHRS